MKRRLKAVLCVILALTLAGLCACARRPDGVRSLSVGNEIRGASDIAYTLHSTAAERFENTASADGLGLMYDRETGAVGVKDTAHDILWSALPFSGNGSAAVLAVALVSEQGRSYLNSQDNSVAFGTFSMEETENGFSVEYRMAPTADTAKKAESELAEGELYFRVRINYMLEDGAFTAAIDCGDLFVSEGYVPETLSFLPSFGAVSADAVPVGVEIEEPDPSDEASASQPDEPSPETAEEKTGNEANDAADAPVDSAAFTRSYMLVPDGCGAVMYTDTPDAGTANLTFRLDSKETGVNIAPAGAGYFGVCARSAGFAGVIRKGEAIASIRAIRAEANADGLNTVYPEFTLTPSKTDGQTYLYGARFNGRIEVVYRFVYGVGSNPVGLASACRETLIRNSMLSQEILPEGYYPLNTAFVVSVTGSGGAVTGYAQAEDLAGVLKGKGVKQMNLVAEGALTGGVYQAGSRYAPLGGAGGKKDLADLCSYAAAQNYDIYAAVNLLTAGSSLGAAKNISGERASVFIENPLAPYIGGAGKNRNLAAAKTVDANTLRLLNRTDTLGFSGYAVTDADTVYADFGRGEDASSIRDTVNENLKAISTRNGLLLHTAGFGSLRYADLLTELSFSPSFAESDAYAATPFLPAVLHGTLSYSGAPVNEDELYVLQLLKCVEYGAAPYARWVFSGSSPLFYERNYADITEFFVNAAEQLGDLSDQRIVAHEKAADGVFATTYEGGSIVLVNYNHYSVNVGNINVPPYNYIRII